MTDMHELLQEDGGQEVDVPKRRQPGGSRRPAHRRMRQRPAPAPVNFYPDVAAFVAGFLAPTYAHDWSRYGSGDWHWCASWWLHVEAIVRLESLWMAWEHLRLDPTTGRSVWLLHHADPTMAALTSPAGPFVDCKPDAHVAPPALVVTEPPPGMFPADPPEAVRAP